MGTAGVWIANLALVFWRWGKPKVVSALRFARTRGANSVAKLSFWGVVRIIDWERNHAVVMGVSSQNAVYQMGLRISTVFALVRCNHTRIIELHRVSEAWDSSGSMAWK